MAVVEPIDRAERRRRGAWYTPGALVRFLVEQTVEPATKSRAACVTVLDPACGDGRLLAAAGAVADAARVPVELVGMEADEVTAALARGTGARVLVGDGRRLDPGGQFDVVIGNPPYLGQLAAATSRGGRSGLGGGPYADVAAEFLVRAVSLARPDGGRVALVLPQSILASRDTAPVRVAVQRAASVTGVWWVGTHVFDAEVNVCVLVLQRGVPQTTVRRWTGAEPRPLTDAPAAALRGPTWSPLVADLAGIPPVDLDEDHGRLRDLATATAGFRDQYYGLVPLVRDAGRWSPPG
jgi:type I restriction-modification system DNA methylase subunit